MFLRDNKSVLLITALTIIGILLRFYNLNWGAPFYFHPDERNMAAAISQLSFPNQMNPHFFAYGSLPLYVFYFTGLFHNFVASCMPCPVSFEQAILISRSYAATFSVLLIPLLAFIGTKLFGRTAGILAAALGTFSVGFIQFAHFGTTEMWLTFFSVILFMLLYRMQERFSWKLLLSTGLVLGILVATKISSLALCMLPVLTLSIACYREHERSNLKKVLLFFSGFLLILLIAGTIYLLSNPYVLLDYEAFRGSMIYETTLAQGTLPVFYTQEFFGTMPGLFQYLYIFPFLLNPLLTVLLIPSLVMMSYRLLRYKDVQTLLLLAFFGVLFFSQVVLFVKWTRYMLPVLPFIYLIMVGAADTIVKQRFFLLRSRSFRYGVSCILITICSIFAFSYVQEVYGSPDTRVVAAAYARQNLPKDARYLSEVYDLGIVPFNDAFPDITLFNFYDLDTTSSEASPQKLMQLMADSDYIIVPSQRVYKTRIVQDTRFPRGHAFYTDLDNSRGYRKIYETSCSFFCYITYLGNPVFSYETTASVFDRPTVMIYEKTTK